MSRLASELCRQGATVQILTAQWEANWPTRVVHGETPVTRLPNPPIRAWGTLRYMRSLSRWLRQNVDNIDAVYVSMLKHDAYAAIGALAATKVPVILRAEGTGPTGDCRWQEEARFGNRIRRRCQLADCLVAPSEEIEQEMIFAGFDSSRIREISNGVDPFPERNAITRAAHRSALSSVNHDLTVKENAPVVVFTGRLHAIKSLETLIDAFRPIAARWPHARLWLIGDGPQREELRRYVVSADLRFNVMLPGSFDDIESILHAADAFVLPSLHEGLSVALLEAMSAGVPIAASDIPGNRAVIQHNVDGLLFPVRDADTLAEQLSRLLNNKVEAFRLGQAARKKTESSFSLVDRAVEHLQLFQECIERKSG
ncbi:MAG: glycosyltransferase involved in cell wall biosynthesis [Pirellulaceae bacterium]|jgi:glycosyltransferase involved in cell wall biosynthesis